jgi:hypothetical protein
MWLMPQKWVCLARLCGEYGLKTAQGCEAAKELGLNIRRGAAKVAPWQEELLRPVLQRMKWAKDEGNYTAALDTSPVRYEASDEHSGYVDESARFGFSNNEMARQLAPILKRMEEGKNGTA